MGEVLLSIVLSGGFRGPNTDRAADGWAGDRYVVWRAPDGRFCFRAVVAAVSLTELDELERAAEVWERRAGGEATRQGERMVMSSCA